MSEDIDLEAVSQVARKVARTEYPDFYDVRDLAHAFAVFVEWYAAKQEAHNAIPIEGETT